MEKVFPFGKKCSSILKLWLNVSRNTLLGVLFSQEGYTPKETILLHIGISNVLITLFTVYKNDMVDSKPE